MNHSDALGCVYRCRAPIASLDCMEEFTGTAEQLTMHAAPTKEALLSGYHSQSMLPHVPHTANQASRQSSVTPGLRYRNLGKSGLRVSNVGLGMYEDLQFWVGSDPQCLDVHFQSGKVE